MSQPDPEIEPADLEERIYQGLRRACDGALLREGQIAQPRRGQGNGLFSGFSKLEAGLATVVGN